MKYYLKDKKGWLIQLPRKKVFNIVLNSDKNCNYDYKWMILAWNKTGKEDNFPITDLELSEFFISDKEKQALKFNDKLEKELK